MPKAIRYSLRSIGDYMIWSKLKKTTESLLADSLRGRIKYHLTRYGPGESYIMNRGWITFDKREIISFSTIKRDREEYKLTGKWWSDDPEALERLLKANLFTRQEYVAALEDYVNLKIEDALQSSDLLVRAFAMFDRRLGKRTLRNMVLGEKEHPLIIKFYRIRCGVEGIATPTVAGSE
jgi:hypothetical protein